MLEDKSLSVTCWNDWDGVYRASPIRVQPEDRVEAIFTQFKDWGINDLKLRYKDKELSPNDLFSELGITPESSVEEKKIEAIYFGKDTHHRSVWYNHEKKTTEYTKEKVDQLNREYKIGKYADPEDK
jgi:hypothetical protein